VLASRLPMLDSFPLADIIREELTAAAVITDGHPAPADATNDQTLQQSRTFSWRTFTPVLAKRMRIFAQAALIVVVLLQRDVPGMRTGNHQPLVPWHLRT